MRIRRGLVAYATLIGLTIGISGNAQPKSDSEPKLPALIENLQETCKSDLEKYCKKVTAGEGRKAACLESKEDQLSADCKAAWTQTKTQVSKRVDKTDVAFRKSCGKDVQKFCSDVPSGRGRLLSCLDDHKGSLSNSCEKFYTSLEQELSKLVG